MPISVRLWFLAGVLFFLVAGILGLVSALLVGDVLGILASISSIVGALLFVPPLLS